VIDWSTDERGAAGQCRHPVGKTQKTLPGATFKTKTVPGITFVPIIVFL